jgi:sulfatase modifying factor 1
MIGDSRQDPAWHLFIAYSHHDHPMALALYDHLHAAYRVFLDAKCLLLGDAWDEKLPAAQKRSLVTVVLISRHTDSSWFQREEIASAIQLARDRESQHRVIPVYLDGDIVPEDVPYGLRRLHGVTAGPTPDMKDVATALAQTLCTLGLPPSTSDQDNGPELPLERADASRQDARPQTISDPNKLPYQGSAPTPTPPFEGRAGAEWTHPTTGIVFVFVPPGRYTIGGGSGLDENPRHTVLLSGFWLGKYPVTNSEYWRVLRPGGSSAATRRASEFADTDASAPVVHVSWADAMAFCERIGASLPTEVHWEAAARGTRGRLYPWGTELPCLDRCNFGSSVGRPTDVHRYAIMGAGPFGTCDQCGNVWEWCLDTYREDAYRMRCLGYDPVSDRTAPSDWHDGPLKVARGGSWKDQAEMLPSTRRIGMSPNIGYGHVGFRVCISRPKG